jgi:hypothetical protein
MIIEVSFVVYQSIFKHNFVCFELNNEYKERKNKGSEAYEIKFHVFIRRKIMKTIANSVRIGMVRRRSVSPIPSDVPSSSIAQAEADYKLIRKQVRQCYRYFLNLIYFSIWQEDELVAVHL